MFPQQYFTYEFPIRNFLPLQPGKKSSCECRCSEPSWTQLKVHAWESSTQCTIDCQAVPLRPPAANNNGKHGAEITLRRKHLPGCATTSELTSSYWSTANASRPRRLRGPPGAFLSFFVRSIFTGIKQLPFLSSSILPTLTAIFPKTALSAFRTVQSFLLVVKGTLLACNWEHLL